MTRKQKPWLALEALQRIDDVLQKDICDSDMLDEIETITADVLRPDEEPFEPPTVGNEVI